jgi:cytochrome c-type biogenesis protein CcmF
MTIAHVGLGVWALGVTFVSSYGIEKDVRLAKGKETDLAGYTFGFDGAKATEGPNYQAQTGAVSIEHEGSLVARLAPEKRFYPSQRNVFTESAVDAGLMRDLYVSLGEGFDDGSWSLRLYVKPMIRFIWLGGILMFFGGILAVSDRRYRLAMAAERRAVEAAGVVPA